MRDGNQVVAEIAKQAVALARSASAESVCLREAQERLSEAVTEICGLANETAEVAASFRKQLLVDEGDLRQPVRIVAMMTGIVKSINELSGTIESIVLSQSAATRSLAKGLGEAVAGAARIANQMVSLSEAVEKALPGGDRHQYAEFTSLATELHDLVAHLQSRRRNEGTTAHQIPAGQASAKPPYIN